MTFAHPFLAILAAAAFFASIIFSAMALRRKKAALSEFADAKILPKLSRNISQFKIYLKAALFASGLALAVLALARPQWGYKWEEVKQMGVDIIFAVDTSKSMMAEDIKPNRLERAKLAISDVIERLDGDRIGLVAFSGQAFLQCPITLDYDAFKMSLDALDTNIIQRGGTNIAAAIDEAQSAFSSSKNQKILVLISDGEELEQSGIARAERAAKEIGMKIYTLGVGSASGEPIPVRGEYGKTEFLKDASGNTIKSMLNEDLLKKVAAATGGIYANLSDEGMDAIYEEGLKKAPKAEISARMKKLAIERFQIPLAIAILLLALEFCVGTRRIFGGRGGSALAVALLALPALFAPEKAFADNKNPAEAPAPKQQASEPKKQIPEPKNWQEFFNAGVDALEKKDAPAAQENFIKAIARSHNDMQAHAKSYYNMGCLDYELAKSAFEKSNLNLQSIDQALGASHAALQSSAQTIKKGQDALKNSGEEALKEQNLQNEIKGEISKCEQSKKSLQDAEKTSEQAVSKLKAISAQTLASQKNFANASELDPAMQSASRNLEAAQNALKNIANIGAQTKASGEKIAANIKALDVNIEELKKLLRDDNKQNNQDNQQQNQQDNKDNQDQQNNQNNQQQNQQSQQQNNQDQQNQQNQNNQQQNSQENKDNQNNQDRQNNQNNQQQNQQSQQQNNQDQQNQQNQNNQQQNSQENKDNQNNQDRQQQDGSKNQDAQSGSGKDDSQGGKDRQQQKNNAQNQGDKKDDNQDASQDENGEEDAQKESSGAAKPEAKDDLQNEQAAQDGKDQAAAEEKSAAKQDEAAAMQEASAKQAEERQAAAAENAADENSPDYRAQTGVMTRREASQVLDSMKEGEKKLPFSGYGSQRSRFEDKKYKDW